MPFFDQVVEVLENNREPRVVDAVSKQLLGVLAGEILSVVGDSLAVRVKQFDEVWGIVEARSG
jgi:hypothetical protein